jgi:hypothetical protein
VSDYRVVSKLPALCVFPHIKHFYFTEDPILDNDKEGPKPKANARWSRQAYFRPEWGACCLYEETSPGRGMFCISISLVVVYWISSRPLTPYLFIDKFATTSVLTFVKVITFYFFFKKCFFYFFFIIIMVWSPPPIHIIKTYLQKLSSHHIIIPKKK